MKQELYELTNPQKPIWLTEQYFTNTAVSTICGYTFITDTVNLEVLKKAIYEMVKSNDGMRLKINSKNDTTLQYVSDFESFDIPTVELQAKEDIEKKALEMANTPFMQPNEFLFQFLLFKLSNGSGGFIVNVHHLIGDSWSLGLIAKEVTTIYSELLADTYEEKNYPSYLHYIEAENNYKNSDKYLKDKAYWEEVFKTIPEVASLNTAQEGKKEISCRGNREKFTFLEKDLMNIKAFCDTYRISIYNFFMAVYSLYVSRVSNLNDFVMGTPILNRTNFDQKHTMGMFISVAPLRIQLDNEVSFIDFVKKIATDTMSIFRHQKYSYQTILEDLRKRNSSIPNLYNVILSYQITKTTEESNQVHYSTDWVFNGCSTDELQIHLFDLNEEAMTVAYDYKSDKFDKEQISKLHNRILAIIYQIISNENISLKEIDIVTSEEKHQILYDFNHTKVDYPRDKTIVDLFEEQVEKTPNNIAVVFEDQSLTYLQLSEKVNQLAYHLHKNGVGYNDVVCLFFDKSLEVVISILAILKCNAIYLPIDIEYPIERINYILENSKSKAVLSVPDLLDRLNGISIMKLPIKLTDGDIFNADHSNFSLPMQKKSTDLAYIMYTSGSTGKPKGSMIMEKSVVRLVKNPNYVSITPSDHIIQTGSIVFDACTFELWGALLNGATVYLILKQDLLNPIKLKEYLSDCNISIMFITTALFNQLAEYDPCIFNTLKYLLTGGEAVSVRHMKLVRDQNPSLNLIHCYGPTENTTFSTCYPVKSILDTADTVSIGTPIANSTCYVVSPTSGTLQPVCVPGELWVGGDGVAKGYLANSELTQKQFIENPFGDGIIYKTGDLVKWLPDGNIEFIGRIDNQIKIRGFRIELSEIDNKILSYPEIKQSVTIIHEKNNKKYICSYFVASSSISLDELKTFLETLLPSYMIPHYMMQLEHIPMNINAKIDRKSLPVPEIEMHNKEIVKPRNSIEEELYADVSKLLDRKDISIFDDFIDDLEMDSLSIMSLSTKLAKYHIEIQDINDCPSIEKLANKINHAVTHNDYLDNIIEDVKIQNVPFTFDLSNILLTGCTGFLGAHLLKELLLDNNVNRVYCLVRTKNNISAQNRLRQTLLFYFNLELDQFKNKIVFVEGDFEKNNFGLSQQDYQAICASITSVLHCGANVHHYGKYATFYKTNILGTQHMIQFCQDSNSSLAHISTLSVGGYCLANDIKYLEESTINVGQSFGNQVYMITKYKAECEILKAINNKQINAKIFRLGNIMPRFEDGRFQKNINDNAFISRLHTIKAIRCLPKTYEDLIIDISPVDLCAKSIVTLLHTNEEQSIYHIYNPHTLSIGELLKLLGISIENCSFQECISKIQEQNNPLYAHLLNDLLNNHLIETRTKNACTKSILNKYGFSWNTLNSRYWNYLKEL